MGDIANSDLNPQNWGRNTGGDIGKALNAAGQWQSLATGITSAQAAADAAGGIRKKMPGSPELSPMPGADEREKRYMEQIKALQAQSAGIKPGEMGQTYQTALQGIQQRALGQGPSAADIMLQRQQEQNLANALAMQRSQRGGNVLAAQRMAGQQLGVQQQQALGQAAQLKAQEQVGAQGQMLQASQLEAQKIAQDRQQQAMFQDLARQYEMMGLTQAQAQMQAANALKGMQYQAAAAEAQSQNQFLGGLISTGAQLAPLALL